MAYHKIIKKDNWGHYSFYVNGKEITENSRIEVLFPDGSKDVFQVQGKPVSNQISDHGHNYTVSTQQLGFHLEYKGIKLFVPIGKREREAYCGPDPRQSELFQSEIKARIV